MSLKVLKFDGDDDYVDDNDDDDNDIIHSVATVKDGTFDLFPYLQKHTLHCMQDSHGGIILLPSTAP